MFFQDTKMIFATNNYKVKSDAVIFFVQFKKHYGSYDPQQTQQQAFAQDKQQVPQTSQPQSDQAEQQQADKKVSYLTQNKVTVWFTFEARGSCLSCDILYSRVNGKCFPNTIALRSTFHWPLNYCPLGYWPLNYLPQA